MSRWDVNRQKKKGTPTSAPHCSLCGDLSVLDPCRSCAPIEPTSTSSSPTASLFDQDTAP